MQSIDELTKLSDAVLDAVDEAHRLIRRDIWTNGYGILSDPSLVRCNLHDARKQIDAALKALNETKWPSAADYDALAAAHNKRPRGE